MAEFGTLALSQPATPSYSFVLVYIDLKRIETFNMKLTQGAMKLKPRFSFSFRYFYIILVGSRLTVATVIYYSY